jgi:LPXTG-motif cell wall-anchored protein
MKRLMIGMASCGLVLFLGAGTASAQGQQTDQGCYITNGQGQLVLGPAENCVEADDTGQEAVLSETLTVAPQVAAAQTAPTQTLPVTGGDVLTLAGVGAAAVLGGATLLVVRRRRAEA